MIDDPFQACWHRWDRANRHRAEMIEVWNSYIANHPYEFTLIHQGAGVHILRVWETTPMPADFAVIVGEWLYNLRAVLDYTIWAAAAYVSGQVPPPNEGVLQFPIYDDAAAWRRNLYRLKGLAPHHVERLHLLQPYNSDVDANYLGWINRLARIDRHRSLVNGTAYLAEIKPVIAVDSSKSATLQWGDRVLRGGQADVARITITPWDDETEVRINPRVGIDPEIAEWSTSTFWARRRFSDRIQMLQVWVSTEIAAFEYDCRGEGRNTDLLSEEFRRICDQRRDSKPLRREHRSTPRWGAAEPGAPSTRQTFGGQGFPSGPQLPS